MAAMGRNRLVTQHKLLWYKNNCRGKVLPATAPWSWLDNRGNRQIALEETQVIQDSDQTAATPRLGLAKGIIAIVLGVLWLFIVPLIVILGWVVLLFLAGPDGGPGPGFAEHPIASLIVGVVLGIAICGLCIWRGILAIRSRKVNRVTRLNFALWLGFLLVTLAPGLVFLALLLL